MLFELRRYETTPGTRDRLVEVMEAEIIPFQTSKGVVILGSFVAEEDPNVYVWLRRFENEEHRNSDQADRPLFRGTRGFRHVHEVCSLAGFGPVGQVGISAFAP